MLTVIKLFCERWVEGWPAALLKRTRSCILKEEIFRVIPIFSFLKAAKIIHNSSSCVSGFLFYFNLSKSCTLVNHTVSHVNFLLFFFNTIFLCILRTELEVSSFIHKFFFQITKIISFLEFYQ